VCVISELDCFCATVGFKHLSSLDPPPVQNYKMTYFITLWIYVSVCVVVLVCVYEDNRYNTPYSYYPHQTLLDRHGRRAT
jgi:hypothetical protein